MLCDLGTSKGSSVAKEIGDNVIFVPVDVSYNTNIFKIATWSLNYSSGDI